MTDFAARPKTATGAAWVQNVGVPSSWPTGWDLADAPSKEITASTSRHKMAESGEVGPGEQLKGKHQPPAEPIPLIRPVSAAKPYPVEALGEQLAEVAGALHEIVQSPPAMCANTVLAVVTLVAQAHIDVELPIASGAIRPVSSMFLTVGCSGERKSATDDLAMRAVEEHEAKLRTCWERDDRAYKIAHSAWDGTRKAILATRLNVDRASREAQLRGLGEEPFPPLIPIMTMADPTIEGLAKLLLTGQPSVGVFSAEGGQFIGGHAMSDDAKLRSAAGLSNLWDGVAWKRVRSLDGAHTIANRRLSMHLMVQPGVATQFANDSLLRDQGLLSRVLITWPETTMGTRLFKDPSSAALTTVRRFTARLGDAFSLPVPFHVGARNELAPRVMRLSSDARAIWIEFSDKVERALAPGQKLEPISGFAAKMAEHVARLAAVIAWWSDHTAQEVDSRSLRGAIRLVEHYGEEALRLWQASVVPKEIADAQRLLDWLERWSDPYISIADITHFGPNSIRVTQRARQLVKVLEDHHWLVKASGTVLIGGKKRREAWRIIRRA